MGQADEPRPAARGAEALRRRIDAPTRELADWAIAEAWGVGVLGIEEPESGNHFIVYFPPEVGPALRAALAPLCDAGLLLGPEEGIPEVDWSEQWKQGLTAIEISDRLVVRPSFVPHETRPGQRELLIDPGQAFGTGGHASTRLILEWVDVLLRDDSAARSGRTRVLDVGTGTGVLAMAALVLGAGRALGLDLDHVAVREAKGLAERNGLDAGLSLFSGPIEAVSEQAHFDLVLANLLKREVLPIAGEVARRMRPGGWLVLSGLLDTDRDEVLAAFAAHGCTARGERQIRSEGGECWIAPWLERGD